MGRTETEEGDVQRAQANRPASDHAGPTGQRPRMLHFNWQGKPLLQMRVNTAISFITLNFPQYKNKTGLFPVTVIGS